MKREATAEEFRRWIKRMLEEEGNTALLHRIYNLLTMSLARRA